jgi:hypothetical protein
MAFAAGAVAAYMLIRKAITVVITAIKEWVNLAKVQELAEINLASALKAAGEYTDELNKKYQDFASGIQDVTKYGDEQVLTLMALMKNLGVTTDKLEEAAKMTIGLATATGRGADSMGMYVALAMQGEFTMLRRYIPALRSTTDATEQLKIITDFAARGFQVAQDQTDSFAIGLQQIINLWNDLKEKLGDFIIKNQLVLDLMRQTKERLIEANEQLSIWYKNNEALINQKTVEVIDTIATAIRNLTAVMKALYKMKDVIKEVFFALPGIKELSIAYAALSKVTEIKGLTGVIRMPIIKPEVSPFDWEQYLSVIKKVIISMDDYIKSAKELAAIEYAPPFDWEKLIPTETQVDTMEAYVKMAKELALIEYAPPFDWEQWIPAGEIIEGAEDTKKIRVTNLWKIINISLSESMIPPLMFSMIYFLGL